MNNNTLIEKSDLIWSTLNSIDGSKKTKQDQIELIKTIILKIAEDERRIGRMQVLNHFKAEIETLSE